MKRPQEDAPRGQPMPGESAHASPRICGAETRICRCDHHRRDHEPERGKCGVHGCTCQAFAGRVCTARVLMAAGRCRQHGGANPGGLASSALRTGRWSKHLPAGLSERFQEGLADPFLTQIRQDVALIDAALTEFTERLKAKNRPLTKAQRQTIIDMTEARRKLIESDARRQRELQLLVPVEKVMLLVTALANMVREFVPRENLRAAQSRMRQLLLGHQATEAMPVDADR